MIISESNFDSCSYENKKAIDELQVQFSKFGISSIHSKVYIFLGKYGPKTANEICHALGLTRTETYQLLANLQKQGGISATFQHPISFSAFPLEKAIESMTKMRKLSATNIDSEKNELSKIWDSIPIFNTEPQIEKNDKFKIIKGEKQIIEKIANMVSNSKKELLLSGNEDIFIKFYQENIMERLDTSQIKSKILTNCSKRTLYVFDNIDRTKVKTISNTKNSPDCFVIQDSKEAILIMKYSKLDHNSAALWTNSEAMIYSIKLLFNLLWSKAKSIPL